MHHEMAYEINTFGSGGTELMRLKLGVETIGRSSFSSVHRSEWFAQ